MSPNEVITQSARAIYFIAASQIVVSLFVGRPLGAVDGVCFVALAFWLARRASIVPAALLFIWAVVDAGLTMIRFAQGRALGGLIVVGILLWASTRALFTIVRLRQSENIPDAG